MNNTQEQVAQQAALAVSAVMRLFETGQARDLEDAELEALEDYLAAELQDRRRQRDRDFPNFDGEPF